MNKKTIETICNKTWTFRIRIFFCVGLLAFVVPDIAEAIMDVRDSIVKIYCVQNEPDYDNPWNMEGPNSFSGSGCVIPGNRILTNAHVVSNHTFIKVRQHGQSKKYLVKVYAISHEVDLALLTVEDPSFFQGIEPLELGVLPETEQDIVVFGFPEGGDTLSTTTGVISRIEHQRYAHSLIEFLAGQLDAAINSGNSGGPVLVDNRIVGVVMQTLEESENIGYMVPVPIIKHFLTDMEDGQYDGFPQDGIIVQSLENASLKKMYGLNDQLTGALVTAVIPGTPAEKNIFPGDVILSIDGHEIADDCTVEFRPKERTSSDFYVQQHHIGDDIRYKILRNGKKVEINLTLFKSCGDNRLVPMLRYDVQPTYFVFGGLVFCPLTLNYIMSWGDNWTEDAPFNLLTHFAYGKLSQKNEEIIIIIKVLPSDLNNGYDEFTNRRIVEVNGQEILNLPHFISIIENNHENSFLVLKTEMGNMISLDYKKVKEEQAQLLDIYKISADRSTDLQVLSTNK